MICKNCGQTIPDGKKFCTHCGRKIEVEETAPEKPKAVPKTPKAELKTEAAPAETKKSMSGKTADIDDKLNKGIDLNGGRTMKQYKTVAGPMVIKVGKGKAQDAFDLFADIMNAQAAQGWTYHSMEAITVSEKPGCLQQTSPETYYMLIFEREV